MYGFLGRKKNNIRENKVTDNKLARMYLVEYLLGVMFLGRYLKKRYKPNKMEKTTNRRIYHMEYRKTADMEKVRKLKSATWS